MEIVYSQRNSHTHCQAAPANAKTQAWQRVCLPNRTTKTTDKPTDEKEHRTDNTGLAKVAVLAPQTHLWLIKVWFSASTFVVKIATFAKPENVTSKPNRRHNNDQTDDFKHKMKR